MVPIDAENASDKIQNHFMLQTRNELHLEATHLNIVKATCDRHTANVLNGERLSFSPRVRNEMGTPTVHAWPAAPDAQPEPSGHVRKGKNPSPSSPALPEISDVTASKQARAPPNPLRVQ